MPGGLDAGVPTFNVPPILTSVRVGGCTPMTKGELSDELPMAIDMLPPLLPVNVALGPFIMDTDVFTIPSTSKMASK